MLEHLKMADAITGRASLMAFLIQNVSLLLLTAILYYILTSYYACGFNRYPGPFLAKFGKLWHYLDVRSNNHQLNLVRSHRKYGDIVRIGPTSLSIADPDYVSKVYSVTAGLRKSDMYDVFAPRVNGKPLPSLLSAKDPQIHAELHKPMAKEFSASVITEYEPLTDKTIQKWMDSLNDNFSKKPDAICPMSLWVRLFAMDAILYVTFSEYVGFLDTGKDVDGVLDALDASIDHGGLLTTMPWLAYFTRHNPLVAQFKKDNTMFPDWAAKKIMTRLTGRAEGKSFGFKDSKGRNLRDFLDRFLDASPTNEPPGYNFPLVMNWCLVNIMAGGDTTAIGLGAIIHYVLKHPEKHSRLVKELRSFDTTLPFSWKQCQSMPYLDACIREGFRLHPSVGLGLERDAAGLVMPDGYVLPEGSQVSMNAWVINRQERIFGDQVDDFIPERWLQQSGESEDQYRERTTRMKRVDLNFGSGARVCTGRYVAMMETYKAVATLFHEFDLELVDPDEEWITVSRWLTRQTNINCKIKKA